MWTRGVDTEAFKPEHAIDLGFPRPIFVSVGRIAVEKNLEAFLSLDLPGTKVVIGEGPQEAELRRRFPTRVSRLLENPKLAEHLAAADAFVFQAHGYLRHRAARSARERRSDCRISGHRPAGRYWQ